MNKLENLEDAEKFFRELTTKEIWGNYAGIEFMVHYHGTKNVLLAMILGLYYALADKLFFRFRGHYLTFMFPESIGLDLHLQIRNGHNIPNVKFSISTIDNDKAEELLAKTKIEVLRSLGEKYNLDLNDYYMKLGPLLGDPTENAQTLHLAAELVKDLLSAKKIDIKYKEYLSPDDNLVEVISTSNKIEAQIFRSMLDSSDIPCLLDGMQDASPWGAWTMASTGKIRIFVKDVDFVSAKNILQGEDEEV